jgi:cytochrome c-type biogenesis protein CcmF
MVVHLGTIILAVAFAASSSYARQAEVRLSPGEEANVAGHTVEYIETVTRGSDRVVTVAARVRVDGDEVFEPRLNRYRASGMVIGTPSVRVGPTRDVYLALTSSPEAEDSAGATNGDEIGLRVIIQPMVVWLWTGGIVMVLGTVLALVPTKRRRGEEAGTPEPESPEGTDVDEVLT